MEPGWHQNGIKNCCLLERAIFQKSCSGCSAGGPQRVLHRTVRWGTSLGLGCKNAIQVGMHLGIDFSLIMVVFGRLVGKEHRAKSEQKSIQKRIEKIMKKVRIACCWVGGFHARASTTRGPTGQQNHSTRHARKSAVADDGKRFVEVNGVNAAARNVSLRKKRNEIEKTRGRGSERGRGDGASSRSESADL